ncbi:cilia- and flagella-associated protein 144-like [Babylonia areolata]|uniref:cilia- and flagella-associated protein 144-like n=1 Tax=Babylonia areolata TaxID=304850 RepID=UPI003FD34AB8
MKRSHMIPVQKYKQPQTEAQEIGWISKPLLDTDIKDRRLNFHRQRNPLTHFMEKAWLEKEQQNMSN